MRHLKAKKKLGRSPSHRTALLRNMAMALIQHERITTTLAKAKALRPYIEKLITQARKGTLHARRLVISRLGPAGLAQVNPSGGADADTRTVVQKLFEEIGPRFATRPGGYTRVLKLSTRRLGDAGQQAIIELLKEGEEKVRFRAAAAPAAPAVEEEEREDEQTEEETEEQAAGEEEGGQGEGAEGEAESPNAEGGAEEKKE